MIFDRVCSACKRWGSLFFALFLFICLSGLKVWAEKTVLSGNDVEYHFDVRVLLSKEMSGEPIDSGCPEFVGWSLSSAQGFVATDLESGATETLGIETLIVGVRNGRLTINDRRLRSNSVELVPVSGVTDFGTHHYAGVIHIMLDATGEVYLVNRLDIEDYIFSVLRWESVPDWPLEANKAMAIACRTYVVNRVLLARGKNRDKAYHYDIRATNADQTYRGLHNFRSLWRPVNETRGIVIAFRRTPTSRLEVIEALYDACCGGSIPAKMNGVINFNHAPYLKRTHACHHCRNCKLYNWTKRYKLREFETVLRSKCPQLFRNKLAHVQTVRVSKKDGSGVVHQIQIKIGATWYSLSGEQVYSIFKPKSRMFAVRMNGAEIVLDGRGVGHGLGLCEWGAYTLARQGKKYAEILEYYYTKAIVFTTIRVTSN